MLKNFKFWFAMAIVVLLIVACISDIFGIGLKLDYITGIISVLLSVLITFGIVNRGMPKDTDVKSLQNDLKEELDKIIDKDKTENQDIDK